MCLTPSVGTPVSGGREIHWDFVLMAPRAVAGLAVFPLQDVLSDMETTSEGATRFGSGSTARPIPRSVPGARLTTGRDRAGEEVTQPRHGGIARGADPRHGRGQE
jgi:hypothetical protein